MAEQIVGLLPTDANGKAIQVLGPQITVADDVDGTSDRSALPAGAGEGKVIRVACSQDTYINFGDNTVTAAATNMLMPAGVEYFQVPANSGYIAYLQVSSAGRISVSLMS